MAAAATPIVPPAMAAAASAVPAARRAWRRTEDFTDIPFPSLEVSIEDTVRFTPVQGVRPDSRGDPRRRFSPERKVTGVTSASKGYDSGKSNAGGEFS
ncbi:hypothetical protein GCM10009565_47210 [Amycolatopsis albidoflavus]